MIELLRMFLDVMASLFKLRKKLVAEIIVIRQKLNTRQPQRKRRLVGRARVRQAPSSRVHRRPAMSELRMLSLAAAIAALVSYYSIQVYRVAVEPARAHTTERAR